MSSMYVLKQGVKTVGFQSNDKPYVIGFPTSRMARKVHYNLPPEPKFDLIRCNTERIEQGITFDMESSLFVPKIKRGSNWFDPINECGIYMEEVNTDEFYMYPFKGIGIVIPFAEDEDDNEMIMSKAHVVDPHPIPSDQHI